jgi:hypothetical protein
MTVSIALESPLAGLVARIVNVVHKNRDGNRSGNSVRKSMS